MSGLVDPSLQAEAVGIDSEALADLCPLCVCTAAIHETKGDTSLHPFLQFLIV
jgi:hypothetical protein